MSRNRRARKKRGFLSGTNWHHRKPKVFGGSGDLASGNMVQVDIQKHRAWHLLFDTVSPQEVAKRITATWIDPEWELVARRKNDESS